ncbi:hypothetical protein Nepgr_015851 [Nepenthes gracilis]|uniref:Uncharacterized protein n=1 Tax=Nepenthes gracilis TaxID=150966 RepID=A0AAD3XS03_NEPGR|nr:hypothetical protein Nepgr_015851 [Nepenthes gracilis]
MEFLVPGYSAAPGCGGLKFFASVGNWCFEVAVGAALELKREWLLMSFGTRLLYCCVGMRGAVRLAAAGSSGCLRGDSALNFTGHYRS